jgi:tetratricopeptide (TPR) repeat protein
MKLGTKLLDSRRAKHPIAEKEAAMKLIPVILILLLPYFGAVPSGAVAARAGQDSHSSALHALQEGDVKTAVSLLTQAIKADPNSYSYYNDRGVAYRRSGDEEKALSDYAKALEIKPDYTPALNNRGMLYLQQGLHDKAIQDFEAALKLGELQGKVHTNLGIAYVGKGDYQRAIKEFEAAVSFRPLDYRSFLFMAESLEQVGQKEKALKMYQLALGLSLDPATTGMVEKRIASLEKNLPADKPVPLATVQNERNNPRNSPQGKGDSNQASDRQPNLSRQILPARSIHDAAMKQTTKSPAAEASGIETLDALDSRCRNRALDKFSPASAEIYRQGVQFLEHSEIRKALIRFEDVLQLEKRNKNSYGIAWGSLETGRLYSKMGDQPRAAALFEEAQKLFSRLKAGDETILTLVEMGANKRLLGSKDKGLALYSKAIEEAASNGHYKLAKTMTDLMEGRTPERVVKPASPSGAQPAVQQKVIAENPQKISPSNQAKVPQSDQQPTIAPKEKTVVTKEGPSEIRANIGSLANIGRGPMMWSESGKNAAQLRPAVGGSEKENGARKTSQLSAPKPSLQSAWAPEKRAHALPQDKLLPPMESKSRSASTALGEGGVPSPKALAAEGRVRREGPPVLTEAKTQKEKGIQENLVELKKLKENNDEANMVLVLERLADKYTRQKEYKKALAGLTASLAFRQKLGIFKGQEKVFSQSGLLKEQLGDKSGALEDLTHAMAQAEASGLYKVDKLLAVRARKVAASIGLDSDAALQSLRLLWKARIAGDNHGETEALYLIGKIYDDAERPAEALQYYERSSASLLADKARIYEKIGKANLAEQAYNEALESFKRLDYSRYLNLLRQMRAPKTLSRH